MLVIGFWSCHFVSQAQISQGGLPLSSQNPDLVKSKLVYETMPKIDIERLIAEDINNDTIKSTPWRFGENIDVNYSLLNSGVWDVFPKGDRIWRLGIKSTGALTINLTFNTYHLPPGAKLFVYNADKSAIIGAFTDFNNQQDGIFATTLITGDQIVIEYYEPANPDFPGELNLTRVTHGYRSAIDYAKSLGTSGSCENNVNCPEAAGWENQIRSVCMLVSGGNGFCTGAIVNNTSQNGVPYILTANHCYSAPGSWVFWFNWQSPTCANPTSNPSYNSITGATLRSRNANSDFCLVEMSSTPPSNYNVYYSGWNRENIAATSGAGIHHPDGDIKKISYSNTAFTSNTWSGTPADSHWKINWSDGVTEPGSSGSPMFDQNHRIIGQLHGGPSVCGGSSLWDFYGKFSMSWDLGTTSSTRLKDWLDPGNIAGLVLNGYDPNFTTDPPVANFAADNTNPGVNAQVNFTDLSSNSPSSWSWSFSPSTVIYLNGTSGNSKNPQVAFTQTGTYSVTLTATNAYGNDGETKTNYVNVISCTFNTLPFTESFLSTILPSCWTQADNSGNGQIWQFGTISGQSPNPALNGNYAYLNSDAYGSGNTQNADLITPTLNLSGYSSVNLAFSYYFKSYTASSGTVSYSINNGSTWTTIATFTTTSSANPTTFSQAVNAVAGQPQVKFKWNYTGTFGYYWGIDDINITGSCNLPVAAGIISGVTTVSQGQSSVLYTCPLITNATSYVWTLPTGATGTSNTDSIIVNYSASAVSGNITVRGHNLCGDGPSSSLGITVNPATKTLQVKVYLEGLYIGGGMMRESNDFNPVNETFFSKWPSGIADTVTVVLYNDSYGAVMAKYPGVYLYTDGNLTIPGIVSSLSNSYYITIFQRNSVPVTSATPRSFAGNSISYDFTYPADQAYGNQAQKLLSGGIYGMYTGELDHDTYYAIDGSDVTILDPDIIIGPYGYLLTDLNGDGVVDGSDMTIMDANVVFGPIFWNPLIAK
jgi:PKD repeat protein